jgi:hypothetical protein
MKVVYFFLVALFVSVFIGCSSAPRELVIDSFEGVLNSETVDFGAGEGSSLEVRADKELKVCGEQSIKLIYNLRPSSYMWMARGYNLDVKGAAQWEEEPENIAWKKYNAVSLQMYGRNSGAVIAFDIKDNGGELWRFLLDDDFDGWKEIVCPFKNFFPRGDWQPQTAERNEVLDFPITSFQFEPRLPGQRECNFDCIKAVKIKE